MGYRTIGSSGGGGGGGTVPGPTTETYGAFGLTATAAAPATLTCPSTNNKGTFIDLGTLTENIDGLILNFAEVSSRISSIDIGVGADATAAISDIRANWALTGLSQASLKCPVGFASGERLWGRYAANGASTAKLAVFGKKDAAGDFDYSRMVPLGSQASMTAQGATAAATTTAWVPIGTLVDAAKGFFVHIGPGAITTGRTPGQYGIELSTGAPSAEVIIMPPLLFTSSSAGITGPAVLGPFFMDIPATTPINFRPMASIPQAVSCQIMSLKA